MNRAVMVILLSGILITGVEGYAAEKTSFYDVQVGTIRNASVEFLESLSSEQKEKIVFAIDDDERRAWSNLPATMFKREGISFKEMSPTQRQYAHKMLQSVLSSQGYLKTTGIMHLDEILKGLVGPRPGEPTMFGHDLYWISMFGNPAEDTAWGWQLDGHHLALNIAVIGNEVAVRPAFMGSDPATIHDGTFAGWNVLVAEDEKGKRLFESLDAKQRDKAVIAGDAPSDVITGPGHGNRLGGPGGLPASDLDPAQQRLFMDLLSEYVLNYQRNIAHVQMERILKSGLDTIYFAWVGTREHEPYYYRIHGPTVIVEFTNQYPPGQSSGPINHVHTVFREPGNDYGEDLLRKHLLESPHHQTSRVKH
ncbi:MAG: DUF3500 domain-containing protein [Woeseiaceae bacterium]